MIPVVGGNRQDQRRGARPERNLFPHVRGCRYAEANAHNLDPILHLRAWAHWTRNLTSDILDTVDELIQAIQGLIGSTGGESRNFGGS